MTSLSTSAGHCSRRRMIVHVTAAVLGAHLLSARQSRAQSQETIMDTHRTAGNHPSAQALAGDRGAHGSDVIMTRDQRVARLVRAGELDMTGENQAEMDSYFNMAEFRFHGPDGMEADYAGLTAYFAAVRAAFDGLSIRRGIIVSEGPYIACQTWIEGRFVRPFTQSPVGALPPNGQRVVWDLQNIFRFDDQGRLVEEWVRTDNRAFLRQLGAAEK